MFSSGVKILSERNADLETAGIELVLRFKTVPPRPPLEVMSSSLAPPVCVDQPKGQKTRFQCRQGLKWTAGAEKGVFRS